MESLLLYLHDDPMFSNVLKFYRNMKNKLRSDLLNEIVKIGTWRLTDSTTSTNIEPKGTTFKYLLGDSISESFEKIYIELRLSKSGLRLCALSIEPFGGRSPYTILSSFSYWITGKQPEARRAIQTILLSLLIDTWAVDSREKAIISNAVLHRKMGILHPARYPASTHDTTVMYPLDPVTIIGLRYSLGFDDWHNTTLFQWHWLRTAPPYRGDFDVYIHQPYSERPIPDCIRLVALRQVSSSSLNANDARKVVVVASSQQVLQRFWDSQFVPNSESIILHDIDSNLVRLIYKVCNLIWSDTLNFVRDVSKSIEDLVSASHIVCLTGF